MSNLRLEDVEARNGFIDVADEGDDFHCMPIGFNIGKKVFITDVVFTPDDIDINLPITVAKIKEAQLDYCRCESNAAGSVYNRMLMKEIQNTSILPIYNTKNKATRILMQSGFIKKYVYFRDDYKEGSEYALFMDNLTSYLKIGGSANKHDDAPDALAGLCQFISSLLTHLYDDYTSEA